MKAAHLALALLLAWIGTTHAGIAECRDPTPEERAVLQECSSHPGCALVVAMQNDCAAVTKAIKNFFGNGKSELLSGEYESDKLRERRESAERGTTTTTPKYQALIRDQASWDEAYKHLGLFQTEKRRLARQADFHCHGFSRDCFALIAELDALNEQIKAFNSNPKFAEYRTRQGTIAEFSDSYIDAARQELERQQLEAAQREKDKASAQPRALSRNVASIDTSAFDQAVTSSEKFEQDRPARAAAQQARQEQEERERLAAQRAEQQRQANTHNDAADSSSGWSEALRAVADVVQSYANQTAAGASDNSESCNGEYDSAGRYVGQCSSSAANEPAFCTPGSSYDAKLCSCWQHPNGAGC